MEINHEILGLLDQWLCNKAKSTQKTYLGHAKEFIRFLNCENFGQITYSYFLSFFSDRDKEIRKINTVKIKMRTIKSFVEFLENNDLVPAKEALRIKNHKEPRGGSILTERFLSDDEVNKLLSYVDKYGHLQDKIILLCLIILGIRIGELIKIRWTDIQGNKLTIQGKGNKPRYLILPDKLKEEIMKLPKLNTFIFLSSSANQLAPHQYYERFKTLAYDAGINKKASPHWLRHYHATKAIENGCPIHILKETLGHSNISTTSQYLHVRPTQCSSHFIQIE